jgi:predicted nucleic acid-binding protein
MPILTAVFDACVLYPAPLRDLLMQLSLADLFHARWTEDIHGEWIRNLLQNRPDLKRHTLEHTRDLMNMNVRDCLVTGYQSLIPALTLPDPNDRHVLAAAIIARAEVIVTFNLGDFPAAALEAFGIKAQHPDDFVMRLLDVTPEVVFLAVQRQRQSLRNPPKTVEEVLETLHQQGLVKTTAFLQKFPHRL